jgi:hypothetical protein
MIEGNRGMWGVVEFIVSLHKDVLDPFCLSDTDSNFDPLDLLDTTQSHYTITNITWHSQVCRRKPSLSTQVLPLSCTFFGRVASTLHPSKRQESSPSPSSPSPSPSSPPSSSSSSSSSPSAGNHDFMDIQDFKSQRPEKSRIARHCPAGWV